MIALEYYDVELFEEFLTFADRVQYRSPNLMEKTEARIIVHKERNKTVKFTVELPEVKSDEWSEEYIRWKMRKSRALEVFQKLGT